MTKAFNGDEVWKDIPGYEGLYQVSNFGRVKALSVRKLRGRFYHQRPEIIMKQPLSSRGYPHVQLRLGGISKTISTHKLVASAFVPNPEGKPQINHKNGIKTYNYSDNLEWCTSKENIKHSIDTGLKPSNRGEANNTAKLTESDVIEIRESCENGVSLAKKYNINSSGIYKIRHRETWKHI